MQNFDYQTPTRLTFGKGLVKAKLGIVTLLVALAACHPAANSDWRADEQTFHEQLNQLFEDTLLSEQEAETQFFDILLTTYEAHQEDSLGLEVFGMVLRYEDDASKSLQRYAEAPEWIQQDADIRYIMQVVENMSSVAAGNPYKEVHGIDALTGEEVCLSLYMNGKPTIVDFWASWCGPCRGEIKNHLLALYAQGEVQIVGIAVWEDSIHDTQKAMEQLGITWPVIYTGGRDNSPSVDWGVLAIPTLFKLSEDGIIIASAHSVDEL